MTKTINKNCLKSAAQLLYGPVLDLASSFPVTQFNCEEDSAHAQPDRTGETFSKRKMKSRTSNCRQFVWALSTIIQRIFLDKQVNRLSETNLFLQISSIPLH